MGRRPRCPEKILPCSPVADSFHVHRTSTDETFLAGTLPPNSRGKETETSAFRKNASSAQGQAKEKPTTPASRGAEAIPATRERRSRRAYRPRSGKMRADLPLRRAATMVHDMRQRRPPPHETRGSTGVVGGVEGLAPLTPCPSPGGDHAPMPGRRRQTPEKKKRRTGAPAHMPGNSCRSAEKRRKGKGRLRPYSRPKKRRALSPQSCQSSSGDTPRASAICRTVKTVKAGSLRLPRHGTGER